MDEILELQNLISTFVEERNWEKFHTPKNLAMSISIESAELMEHFQWISSKTSLNRIQNGDSKFLDDVSSEIADILIYTLAFCNVANIDVKKSILRKLETNRERFPPGIDYNY